MSEVYHDDSSKSTKKCSQCHAEKPLRAFHKDAHKKDGYRSACQECLAYRRKHPVIAQKPLFITSIVCASCRVEKPLDCFDKHTQNKLHGHRIVCKACRRAQYKQEYKPRRVALPEPVNGGKVCRTCMAEKPLERFGLDKRASDGRSRQCKDCVSYRQYVLQREQTQARYTRNVEKNGEQYKATRREWEKANRLKLRQIGMRRKARKLSSATGDVSYERILARDGHHCYICEKPILPCHNLEFDHVIPLARLGSHGEDNIKPVHEICNQRKGAKLLSEMTPFQRRGV